jgi:ubiquitin C-terminal hydrolase
MVIHTLPKVLVLHLKRFSYGNMFGKITKPIQFGAELLLPSSASGDKKVKYELYGVVVHHGSSTHSGHYIAYVKVGLSLSFCSWVWPVWLLGSY